MTRTSPVTFGILGAGRIAHAFAAALAATDNAVLAAAASRDPDRAARLGPQRTHPSYEDLLADETVEAVYVATHNGLHRSLTLAALAAGKHVICEKPLAPCAADCLEMVAAARAAGRRLVEAFMYRHHPQIAALHELLEAGVIGKLRTVETAFSALLSDEDDVRYRRDWGGGSLLDVGTYCVNMCRHTVGREPRRAIAFGAFHPACDIDLACHGVVDFGDGVFGAISCGFDGGLRNHAILSGERGVITCPQAFANVHQPTTVIVEAAGRRTVHEFAPQDVYRLEIEDFVTAIRTGADPLLPDDDGLRNARVLDALLASARNQGRPSEIAPASAPVTP